MRARLTNSSAVVLAAVAFCLASPHYSAADFELDRAVGVWLLDEGEGETAADWTGNGNDGDLFVGPEWVDGRFGKALKFNGNNQLVWVRNLGEVPEGADPRTFMCHFKWDSTWPAPGDKNDPGDNMGGIAIVSYGVRAFNGRLSIWLDDSEGIGTQTSFDTVLADWDADNEWHHVAVVYPEEAGGTTTEFLVYVDGRPQETRVWDFQGQAGKALGTGGDALTIGAQVGSLNQHFAGTIDDVALFPFAMDEENILSVARRGLVRGQVLDVSPAGKLATSWGAVKER